MILDIVLLVLFAVCIALSAFFSSSEIAFAKSNPMRLKKEAEAGEKRAVAAMYIRDHYTRSLSTILVGNNLVNIASSSIATVLCLRYLKENGATVATVATTILLLIFGETVPKILAADRPDTFARLFARPLRLCMRVFLPVVAAVERLVGALSPMWTPKIDTNAVTTDDLCGILETIEEEGVFTEEEGELIKSAIEFTDTMAMEILTPRVDMVALDIDDIDEHIFSGELLKHSRIPVYRGSIDTIIGILPTKKLMKAHLTHQDADVESLLVKPLFVHKTRMISSIIPEFRKAHTQLAIVVDEYGGTMGMLTMEDIMEEIVGDIFDERDEVEDECIQVDDDSYIVDGSMNLYDLFDSLEYEPRGFDSEYTTVGGWATEQLDRFPKAGDQFTYDRLHIEVLEAGERRVENLRVTRLPESVATDN